MATILGDVQDSQNGTVTPTPEKTPHFSLQNLARENIHRWVKTRGQSLAAHHKMWFDQRLPLWMSRAHGINNL